MAKTSRLFLSLGILFLIILFLPTDSLSQDGQITGKVLDGLNGDPLVNVNIRLEGTRFGAVTSSLGEFSIENLYGGEYMLTASRIGYRRFQKRVVLPTDSSRQTLRISLEIQPIELSEVIISRVMLTHAGKGITPIPGSAYYIGPRKLSRDNNYDIHRILRDIPGINIQEEDGYGLRPNIGFRGTGAERSQKITLMEDGVLMAPAPYSAPAAYYFPTAGRMHGIEIRKGSSQIKYGPHTTGGALNMISTPIPSDFRGKAGFSAGGQSARKIHALVGDSYNNGGFLVESHQMKVNGFKELDSGEDTGFDKKDYLVKLQLNTNRNAKTYQALLFKIGQTNEISNETYLGLTDADFSRSPNRRYAASQLDQMKSDHNQFQVRHFLQAATAFDVTTTFYKNYFKRNWFKLDRVRAEADGQSIGIADILEDPDTYTNEYEIITGSSGSGENALEVKNNNRKYNSQGIQAVLGFDFSAIGGYHEIELGFRHHRDEMDRFQWVDSYAMENGVMKLTQAGIPGTESNRVEDAKATALYLQYRLTSGNLTVIPGFRYEDITMRRVDYGTEDPSREGTSLTSRENSVGIGIPGIGVSYQFSSSFNSFLGIHKGFAPPGSRSGTKPEESINYEAGVRFENDDFSLQALAFFNDYDNLLGADLAAAGGQGTTDLFNGGEVLVKGLEYAMSLELGSSAQNKFSWPIRISYTYTEGKFKNNFESDFEPWSTVNSGDDLPYLPKHQVSLGVGMVHEAWEIDIATRYVSTMRTKAGSGQFIQSQSIGAHRVVDATFEYTVNTNNSLYITVKNLTQETYIVSRRPAGVRPGLPRTVMGGIKSSF